MPGLSIACTGLGKVDRYEAEIENDGRRLLEGLLFLTLYCALIPLGDYLSTHAGFACEPEGPCTFPVGFGLQATTGALPIGLLLCCAISCSAASALRLRRPRSSWVRRLRDFSRRRCSWWHPRS